MAPPPSRTLTAGQRAYEAKRAAKAGMSLDKWLAEKDRQAAAAEREAAKAAREAAKIAKPAGFFSRLLERAHKPL
jgi:DNA-binding phage protein